MIYIYFWIKLKNLNGKFEGNLIILSEVLYIFMYYCMLYFGEDGIIFGTFNNL